MAGYLVAVTQRVLKMAKFGQAFINQLTSPGYAQGMFNLGSAIGSAPAVAAEKEQKQRMFSELQSAISSNDPDIIDQAAKSALKIDPQLGLELSEKSRILRKSRRTQNAQGSLAYLQNQMQSVLKDSSLKPVEQQNKLNQLQEAANAIGLNVPGLDPMAVGGLSMKVEDAVFQQQEARRQSERADESLNLRFQSFGLQKDQARMAAERHTEWSNTADYRQTIRDVELGEAQYKQAVQLARGLSTVEGGREKFIEAHPDKVGVFDALAKEQEAKDLQLETLRENKEAGKFDYTDEELLEFLGVSENATEEQKQAAGETVKTIQRVSKINPRQANKLLESYVAKKLTGREIPSAAMAGLFKDAALSYVNTIDLPGWDSDEKQEALAAELALKAADAFVNGAPIDQAILLFSADSTSKTKPSVASEFEMFKKGAEAWLKSQMEATSLE